jgi:hypothetical protein
VVNTLQSIKKGISLLDERRADLRAEPDNGTMDAEAPAYDELADDEEEDASLPVRR